MEKLSFINSAFALVSKLPVTDVFVTLKDGNESVISCKLDCNLLQRHFELLSKSRLYVALDIKTSSLIIRSGSWLPL